MKTYSSDKARKIAETLKRKGISPPSNKGKKFTKEHVQKIIDAKRANGSLYHTKETTKKIQASRKIYYDKIGRTSKTRDIVESTERYREWRLLVLSRDKYKCVECSSTNNLQVNHKIPLDHFIRLAENSIERLFEFSNLFDIDNGETLCFDCHKNTDTYGRQNTYGLGEPMKITGRGYIELRNVASGLVDRQDFTNMFVTAGKVSLADAIRGTTSNNQGIITYCAVGTSTTAPALGDTDLVAETFRKTISVREVAANVATFSTFFTTTEANGTLREAGLFGDDASAIPGSGTLFCRAAINRTKTTGDTLTMVWSITIG